MDQSARIEDLERQVFDLKVALFDVISLERTITPDMSGKRRKFAYMRNGPLLAECIDRAWALLGHDWRPTDPAHGGKIPLEGAMKLINVTHVEWSFAEEPVFINVRVNPKSIAWMEPIGTAYGSGPFWRIHFIGNSAITVNEADCCRIAAAMEGE